MLARCTVIALLFLPLAAFAQQNAQPFFNVVTFEANATAEVPVDTLTVTLFTEEQGPDPAALAARANTRLEQALATAKSEPGVEARSGAYQTSPLYDRANQITGWRVRAELVLEGRDFKTVSALAGRMQPALKLGGMAFSLSRAAREKTEASLLADALRKFQARADPSRRRSASPATRWDRSTCVRKGRWSSRSRSAPWPSRRWPMEARRHRRWRGEKAR